MNRISEHAAELIKQHGSPLYVYDLEVIRKKCQELKAAFPTMRLYYACKANTNPEVVKAIASEGLDIETTSPGEIEAAQEAGVPISRIAFTCASINEKELVEVVLSGARVHLDSLTQVERVGTHFPHSEISVRLNLGVGAGHHAHTTTGGSESKFGIHATHLPALFELAAKYNLKITGIHQHIGSGFATVEEALEGIDALFKVALQLPDLTHLDFGGGFGVPYAPKDTALNIHELGEAMRGKMKAFSANYGRFLEMSFEPGRYLVAEAGALLVTVTDIKRNPEKTFVGVDSGMGHLVRPAMYDAYHEIENCSHPENAKEKVTVGGFYCESGDILARDREIPMPEVGDILIVRNAGAYGYVMASEYNARPKPKEVVI